MKKKCFEDKDNKIILENKEIFTDFHLKNNTQNLIVNNDFKIVIPVTINICLINEKYQIDFIKYCKHIINVLNEGFSGKIKNKYKSPEYSETFFSIISNNITHGKIIHNYINYKFDSKIRFNLDSIVYHNKNFEIEFTNTNTELLIENFFKQGFEIKDIHKDNLNINIIKFNCDTLGVSTFPWINIINQNNTNNQINLPMFIFIDYKTIHPDLSTIKFNNSRTIIHEVGHIFGLKHIFKNNINSLECYKILLGEKFYSNIFDNSKYLIYCQDCVKDVESNQYKLYPDIIGQIEPTIKNPIEKKTFILNKELNIPVNFACFMDYSPDEVLTHFTNSQCEIMRTIIYIYKKYLVDNTNQYINKKKNKTKLFLPTGYEINHKSKNFLIKSSSNPNPNPNPNPNTNLIYKIVYNDNFNYLIKKIPKVFDNNNS